MFVKDDPQISYTLRYDAFSALRTKKIRFEQESVFNSSIHQNC
jgi:hypothetical protein